MPNDLIAIDPTHRPELLPRDRRLRRHHPRLACPAWTSRWRWRPRSRSGKDGKSQTVKTLAGRNKAPDLSLVRMAPPDSTQDKMWGWFNDIMTKGILLSDRTNNRKSGSIVMYDSTHVEVARFNFTNGWPSKISTDQLSVDSNDPVKETITLTIESLARVK